MKFEYVYGYYADDMYPDIKIGIERITPEIARKMLGANTINRNLKTNSYSRAMKNGEWVINGASISFSSDGRLLDGQNRLSACIEAGVPFDTIVVRGLKEEAQDEMDTGIPRSLGDTLTIHQFSSGGKRGAIGVALLRVETFGFEGMLTRANCYKQDFTKTEVLKWVDKVNDTRIEPVMRDAIAIQKMYKLLAMPVVAAFLDYLRMHGASEDDYREFVRQLTKKSLPCQSVVVFDKCMKGYEESNKNTKDRKKQLTAIFVKAWNGYMLGSEPKILSFKTGGAHPEKFPEILLS